MIKLQINDKEVVAKKGESVLEVAQRNNIYIPTLCYYKGLSAYGGCRICLVEVEGYQRPVTACTLPVHEGMKVKTESQLLKKLRRFNLQLILSEHPHACLICNQESECARYQECIQKTPITFGCKFCPSNGDCELQKLVDLLEIKEIPFTFSHRKLEVEKYDPFFERDYNLCILCGRCVRVCNEIRGAGTLDFHHRGPETLVGTAFNLPHLETGCQFCGACVDICPTGALRDRYSKWRGLQDRWVKTSCALCSIGCAIKLNIREDNLVNSAPDDNQICVRGRYGIVPLVYHPKRITTPLLKKGKRLIQVDWKTAMDFLCTKLSEHSGKTGILFSSQLTTEAIDAIGSLRDNFIITALPADNDVRPFSFKDIKSEAVFILLNTDMVSDFSPLLLTLRSRIKTKPIFIVIDAMETQGAKIADFWLRPEPGKEQDLLNQLFARGKTGNRSGVSAGDIAWCKGLLDNKNVYVLYNAFNIENIELPKHVRALPMTSMVNALPISKLHLKNSAIDLLQDQDIDCLYLIGTAPKLNKKYQTIIVQDCFLPGFDLDLFLPAATFTETNGSFVNIEGKSKKLRKAIEPLGYAKPDEWIIEQVRRDLQSSVRTGKIRKKRREKNSNLSRTSKKYPFRLITRENCYTYRGHTLASLLKGFERLRQDNHVWLNKQTAKRLKAHNDTEVMVIGEDISVLLPVMISDQVPDNSVFIYAHQSLGMIKSQPVKIKVVKKQS
jgi:NADH dehydrogenase/NADH:ubiquinone oxidoreductase subunit G